MKTINVNSKKGFNYKMAFGSFRACEDIFTAYGRPSYNKVKAWETCKEICKKEKGWGLRIIAYNTCQFTAAFLTNEGLRVETANNSYIVK